MKLRSTDTEAVMAKKNSDRRAPSADAGYLLITVTMSFVEFIDMNCLRVVTRFCVLP